MNVTIALSEEDVARIGNYVLLRLKNETLQVVQPAGPTTKINPKDGAEMCYVPAGTFLMGEDRHVVDLPAYWMYKHPVTVKQYRQFCTETGYEMPNTPEWGWKNNHPIVNVSWFDAKAYADWAGVQLPTEEQWEKAARGTDGRIYPWGNGWDASKCVCSVSKRRYSTKSVGIIPKGASPYGCLDMAGNVWEWCADWYDNSQRTRCLRGGSWYYGYTEYFRCAYRYCSGPYLRGDNCGFRCAKVA